ncbi:MAG: hypothetical protein ACLFOY_04990 [Desulfatibacillaceae bacterium]
MNSYLIRVDMRAENNDYARLRDAMQTFSGCWNESDDMWVVRTSLNAAEIRDFVKQFTDPSDGVFVAGLSGEAAWRGFSDEGSQLLKNLV